MLIVTSELITNIIRLMASTDNESGGLLGSSNEDIIDTFWFDKGKRHSTKEYIPDTNLWEQQLRVWGKMQIRFCGIIHSHVVGDILSSKDVDMARKILEINSINSILMPIFILRTQEIIWYVVSDKRVERFNVEVI